MSIASVNPATGEIIEEFDEITDDELQARIARATDAFSCYRSSSYAQRSSWLESAALVLDERCDQIARMMTAEMGKTIASAQAEVTKCAAACRHYASHAARYLADAPGPTTDVGAARSYETWQPLGPILAVMPWNFPLWQVIRFAAPALMAGNVALLKHASNVPRTAMFLEDLFRVAGFPEGSFQTLLISSSRVNEVLRDRRVVAATLTGSEAAGRSVAGTAGAQLKPTVLELGGSDPFIVMPSADVAAAARAAAQSRCLNNGQSCINAKRFIVHEQVSAAFVELLVEQMSALRVGDPMDPDTDVGPLASRAGREDVAALVQDAVEHGAEVLCGGTVPETPGWFYPPTVLRGVTEAMRLYREECFGPVASVFEVASIEEAIELANATDFGLGSNAWTQDEVEVDRFVRDLQAGMVFINGTTTSYPQLPFGGVKNSGYGRELSAHGIRAFCNLKTVWVGA